MSSEKVRQQFRLHGPDSPISRGKIDHFVEDKPIASSDYGVFSEEILQWIDAQPKQTNSTEEGYREVYNAYKWLKSVTQPSLQEKLIRAERSEAIYTRRERFNKNRDQLMLAMLHSGMAYICAYPICGEMRKLHVDHKIPLSKGGTDDLSNLQFLCRKHNSEKGAKHPH